MVSVLYRACQKRNLTCIIEKEIKDEINYIGHLTGKNSVESIAIGHDLQPHKTVEHHFRKHR